MGSCIHDLNVLSPPKDSASFKSVIWLLIELVKGSRKETKSEKYTFCIGMVCGRMSTKVDSSSFTLPFSSVHAVAGKSGKDQK